MILMKGYHGHGVLSRRSVGYLSAPAVRKDPASISLKDHIGSAMSRSFVACHRPNPSQGRFFVTREPFRPSDDFPPVTPETWRAKVEKDLKGADFDRALTYRSPGSLTADPLYHAEGAAGDASGFPGTAPFTRGFRIPVVGAGAREPWSPAVVIEDADPVEANRRCLHDLSLGAQRVYLKLGRGGVELGAGSDFTRLMDGVEPTFIELVLESTAPLSAAGLLAHFAASGTVDLGAIRGAVSADPLSRLASEGLLMEGAERAWKDTFELTRWCGAEAPGLRSLRIDTTVCHRAGGSPVQELAWGLAAGVEVLRRGVDAGFETPELARRLESHWSVSGDLFLEVAKLRAWRKVWAKVLAATGAEDAIRDQQIHLRPSARVPSRVDPWVNLLRSSAQVFIGAIAGVDSIVAARWDELSGGGSDFGRRAAINSHHVLAEESYLARVADPAGGSWAIEALTERLAEQSWTQFQQLEKAGGVQAALLSGEIQRQIGDTVAERRRDLAERRHVKVGVSMYANLTEQRPGEADSPGTEAATADAVAEAKVSGVGVSTVDEARAAWADGTPISLDSAISLDSSGADAEPTSCDALADFRESERFEALRLAVDAAAAAGRRPNVCLAQLGSASEARARTQFAADFFAVAGFDSEPTEPTRDAEELAAAFRATGAEVAVLCASDEVYQELAAPVARALKEIGARRVYLAGKPGDAEPEWRRAGIDDFIFLKCDAVEILEALVDLVVLQGRNS